MTQPATAVVHQRATPPSLAVDRWSFDELHKFASLLVRTKFLPESITTPEQALAIIMTGRELGIGPMHALRSIAVIKGKPTISSELMLALFKRAGGRATWKHSDEQQAELEFVHPNGDTHRERFTTQDAQRAGLLDKAMWQRYPKAMLRARALAAGLRAVAPDVIAGTYTAEELDADVEHDTLYGGDYGGGPDYTTTREDARDAADEGKAEQPNTSDNTPTEKQVAFLAKLMQSHVWTSDEVAKVERWQEGERTREEYSAKIDACQAELHRRKQAEQPEGETPDSITADIETLMDAAPKEAVKLWGKVLDNLPDATSMPDLRRVREGLVKAITDADKERIKREHQQTQRAALDG